MVAKSSSYGGKEKDPFIAEPSPIRKSAEPLFGDLEAALSETDKAILSLSKTPTHENAIVASSSIVIGYEEFLQAQRTFGVVPRIFVDRFLRETYDCMVGMKRAGLNRESDYVNIRHAQEVVLEYANSGETEFSVAS